MAVTGGLIYNGKAETLNPLTKILESLFHISPVNVFPYRHLESIKTLWTVPKTSRWVPNSYFWLFQCFIGSNNWIPYFSCWDSRFYRGENVIRLNLSKQVPENWHWGTRLWTMGWWTSVLERWPGTQVRDTSFGWWNQRGVYSPKNSEQRRIWRG